MSNTTLLITKLSRMRFIVNEHNQFANEGREKVHSDGFAD